MAFPYSSGDVLTAADLNASSGLVLVKTQTIGSAVSSVTVTNAFSTTFDNYFVSLTDTTPSTGAYFTFSFSSGHASGYYGRYKDENYLGTVNNQNRNNAPNLYVGYANAAKGSSCSFFNVASPFLSGSRKSISGNAGSGPGFSIYGGETNNTASFTGFYMTVTAGTMTGGTIRVYGYNNG
jgi:hypothetical protein